jgi:hypothetical protein
MPIRTRTLALAALLSAAVALPAGAPASDVHAAKARAYAKPRVGDPHTKMMIFVSGYEMRERLFARQTIVTPSDNTFKRTFRFRVGADGTLDIRLKRPQILGSYEFCFFGRKHGMKACAKYRIVAGN